MHRDVKPHNVMIDHENRMVRFPLLTEYQLELTKCSCVSLIGV